MNDTPGAKAGCLGGISCRATIGRAGEGTCPHAGNVRFVDRIDAHSSGFAQKKSPPIAFAWGVLGSAIGGVPFLLTHPVVFRSS
jgi:hypothetical protein